MATPVNLYDIFRRKQFEAGQIDFESADIRVLLVTSSYTPNQNTHDFVDDVSAAECTGTNYARKQLTTGAVTLDGAGKVVIDFDDSALVWAQSASGFSNADRFIVYKYNVSDAAAELVAYSDSFGPAGNVSGNFEIDLHATDGLATSVR